MRHATDVKTSGTWTQAPVSSVTLTFDDRHKRRIRMQDDGGEAFLLDLPDAVLLVDGDGLVLDEGGIIAVQAASEPVADIQCRDATHASRIAWHIGNRHTAIQVLDDGRLRIADDHVLVAMVEGLGARVLRHAAPFQPEPGAYARPTDSGHGHDHHHG
ncbi:MAG: urease accessory protein UreE [Alphaproteobacteria bacterium]